MTNLPPATRRRVTMRTIAERAGVNVSTVSRALRENTSPDQGAGVGAELAQRIRSIADELGYRPDPYAASLKTRRTRAIGVLVPRLSDVVLATIYEGIEECATERGYQAVVSNTRDDRQERRRRVDLLLSRRVDGLILGDAHLDGEFLRELATIDIPVVLTNRRVPRHVSVTCDDPAGGRMVGDHLAELGHRHVGIVAGLSWASTGVDRTRGCREALREHGINVPDRYVLNSPFDAGGGRKAAEQLLDLNPRPTAIFAVNDFAAIGVMGAARDRGLRVGEDLAVVGFNDITIAAELPVPLTTVRSPLNLMGRTAARALFDKLAGKTVRSSRLKPTLVVRASTMP